MDIKRGRPRIDRRIRQFVASLYFGRYATQVEIARFIGVSQSTVARIVAES
jgi:DNA-directed RNA polymerase specialized sigma subunit